jgi:hypothetical protein
MQDLSFNQWVLHIHNELKKHYKVEKEKSVKKLSQYK